MSKKNKSNHNYTLLTYIDESTSRNFVMLFINEEDAINHVLNHKKWIVDGCPEEKLSFNDQYSLFKKNKYFPESQYENNGCFYMTINSISLNEEVKNMN